MSSAQDLRKRIKSVTNTQQITNCLLYTSPSPRDTR